MGVEALAFGINQTKSSYLITSGDQLPKVQKILDKVPHLKTLIVFTDKFTEKNLIDFKAKATSLTVYSFNQVEDIGQKTDIIENYTSPKKDDLAIIMLSLIHI